MELKTYLRILLKKWWIIIPTFLMTFTTTVVLTYTQDPVYQTTATFVVSPITSNFETVQSFVSGLNILSTRSEIATTYTEVAESRQIKNLAMDELGVPPGIRGKFGVSSRLRAGTNVLEITVQGNDPELVRDFANTVGQQTVNYVQQLYETFELKLLDEATLPWAPVRPNKTLNLALGAILGLALGVGMAFLAEYLQSPASVVASFDILDEQTGVYNKYYFFQRLGEEMVRAKRNRYGLSLALVRVDNLKLLKGISATKVRVEILRQVALIASQHLREEDLVAYLGDDVFGILLPDITGENAKSIMEYLQTRITWTPFESTINGAKYNLKTTVGVVTYSLNGTSRDELVAKANQALQLAEIDQDGKAYLMADITD
jgi:diguanylate cyclase (GGDEF)-like protein